MCESQPAPTRCIFRQQDLEALLGSSVLLPPTPRSGGRGPEREGDDACRMNYFNIGGIGALVFSQ